MIASLLELSRLLVDGKSVYISGQMVATVAAAPKELQVERVIERFPVRASFIWKGFSRLDLSKIS